jgi:hypothetical protein
MDAVGVFVMVCLLLGFAPGIRANKKPPFPIRSGGHYLNRGDFCCSVLLNRTSLDFPQASHRGSFSNSSVGTLRLLTASGIPDV